MDSISGPRPKSANTCSIKGRYLGCGYMIQGVGTGCKVWIQDTGCEECCCLVCLPLPVVCCLMLVVGVGLCIAQIAIGSLYFHNCPSQPMVPVFLIVGESISLLYTLTCRPSELTMRKLVLKCDGCREGVIMLVLGILLICWLVVGTVFIVRTSYDIDNYNSVTPTASTTASGLHHNTTVSNGTSTSCPYCNVTVLNFAYSVMITEWCLVGLLALSWPCSACVTHIMQVVDKWLRMHTF